MLQSWGRRAATRQAPSGEPPAPDQVPDACRPSHAAELFDGYGRAVYSLAGTMLGDWRAASALTMAVLDDAVRGEQSASDLLNETHRRAGLYLRHLCRRRPTTERPPPASAPLEDLEPISREALRLVFFCGYTFNEVAAELGRPRAEVSRAVGAAVTRLSGRPGRG